MFSNTSHEPQIIYTYKEIQRKRTNQQTTFSSKIIRSCIYTSLSEALSFQQESKPFPIIFPPQDGTADIQG